jgi:hypothetical protein
VGLNGTAPGDQAKLVTDFNEAFRHAMMNGQLVFTKVEPANIKVSPGGGSLAWSFSADLARGETQ